MILSISIIVVLLSLLLLFNNFSKNRNSFYLCGSLVFMCFVSILHYFIVISPNRFWVAIFVGHLMPFVFLTGPFLYFYTRNELRNSIKWSKLDYLHYLPFILTVISLLPYYFTDFDSKLRIAQIIIQKPFTILKIDIAWFYPSNMNYLLRPILILGYSMSSLILVYRFYKKKKIVLNKNPEGIMVKWLFVINGIVVIVSLGYLELTFHFYNYIFTNPENRQLVNNSLFSYILAMTFSLIPILILIFPEILYGLHKSKENTKSKIVIYKDNHESLISTATLILDFVKNEENLINPNFSIADICSALNIKSHEVNYCFNMILNTKFTTLRKELRVDLAKKELSIGELLLTHSLEIVWIKSGFSSRTNFFIAFKDVTGMTPSEYLKSI